jgi:hypothetical protein
MKHHYVPAFDLRGFTDRESPPGHEPYLWMVDLDKGTVRRRSRKNTATLTDYYAVGGGEERHQVEEYLKRIENLAARVVEKIQTEAAERSNGPVFSAEEKAALSQFLAVQVTRVPGFRKRLEEFITRVGQSLGALLVQSRERYEAAIRQAYPEREFTATEIDSLYEAACAIGPKAISANPTVALGHALNAVPMLADTLGQMSWAVMTPASSGNFWTSDNPVYWINPNSGHPLIGHGLAARSIEVNFPVGSQRCLLLTWSGTESRFPIDDLRSAQERGLAGATRYLFCCCEADAQQALSAHRRMYPKRRESVKAEE